MSRALELDPRPGRHHASPLGLSKMKGMSGHAAKRALSESTQLVQPRQDVPTRITLYASSLAVGAVPQQLVDCAWVSLVFFLQKLKPAETQ